MNDSSLIHVFLGFNGSRANSGVGEASLQKGPKFQTGSTPVDPPGRKCPSDREHGPKQDITHFDGEIVMFGHWGAVLGGRWPAGADAIMSLAMSHRGALLCVLLSCRKRRRKPTQ
jgi:hypothetical protein